MQKEALLQGKQLADIIEMQHAMSAPGHERRRRERPSRDEHAEHAGGGAHRHGRERGGRIARARAALVIGVVAGVVGSRVMGGGARLPAREEQERRRRTSAARPATAVAGREGLARARERPARRVDLDQRRPPRRGDARDDRAAPDRRRARREAHDGRLRRR